MPAPRRAPVQHGMVGWYDPIKILRTGRDVLISKLIGARADFRLLEGLSADQPPFQYEDEEEMWLDYVADLGDGWDSTYAIASLLAAPALRLVHPPKGGPASLARGRVLVMGGDQVYPSASRMAYQERTVAPYEAALFETEPPHPHLFAIPGNHDWYDGLISFFRLFCQRRWMGGWKTQQSRSYFALRLPQRWWLWGVDVQLQSDIDQPQLDYFGEVTREMRAGDRVILATAEPHWIYGKIYDPELQNNLAFLVEKIIEKAGATVHVFVAGDLHHYRRHESTDGRKVQLITAGGGGAFLHPTCGPPVDVIEVGAEPRVSCELKAEFPTREVSERLLLRDLLFPLWNLKFGLLSGLVYAVLASLLGGPLQQHLLEVPFTLASFPEALLYALRTVLAVPAQAGVVVLVVAAFLLFTDTHKKLYKVLAGMAHAGMHLLALLVIGWLALRLGPGWVVSDALLLVLTVEWVTSLYVFLGGYLSGSFLMGLYLYVSLRFFDRHSNEAFSALRIPDYKSFLRMHIDRQGSLTIYAIGVAKVPRRWKASASAGKSDPRFVPAPPHELQPMIVDVSPAKPAFLDLPAPLR